MLDQSSLSYVSPTSAYPPLHQATVEKDEEGKTNTACSPIHSYTISLYSVFYQFINTTTLIGKSTVKGHMDRHLDSLNELHLKHNTGNRLGK